MAFPTSLTGRLLLPLLTFHVANSLFLLAGTGYILGHTTDVGPGSRLGLFIMAAGLLGAGVIVLLVHLAGHQHGAENSRLTETARQMANGSFRQNGPAAAKGWSRSLAEGLDGIASALNRTLGSAVVMSNRLYHSGTRLDTNAGRLTEHVHLQAEKACQIASAAEEMSQSIDEIAGKAVSASMTSCDAIKVVEASRQTAAEAVQMTSSVLGATTELSGTMEKLNGSIQAISEFVILIENIADQTNLLALNAAIEAARSGEHGRGFAVVADEVRNLASKTIQVTSEISATIKGVQAESEVTTSAMRGTADNITRTAGCIHELGRSLDNIAQAFHQVNDQIAQIASAVEQQSATTQEVASAIDQSSQLSRSMGDMAEHVGGEVKALGEITDGLLGVLGGLRLEAHYKGMRLIESIVLKPQMLSMNRPLQEAEMRSIVAANPFIELLYITGPDGRQVTSNISDGSSVQTSYGNDGFGMDWSKRPWFVGARQNKGSYVSDLYRSTANGHFCLTISAAMLDKQGRIIGILGADLDFEGLSRMQEGV